MRKSLLMGAVGGLSVSWGAATASALVVADFQADFTYPTPSNGWSYHWNANGAIGNSANYVPLVPDAVGRYETVNQTPDEFPDPAPGSSLSITQTTLVPGQGRAQVGNGFERYAIVAYTVSAEDIAAAGGNLLSLEEWSFVASPDSQDGLTARVYINDFEAVRQPLEPGQTFDHTIIDPNGGAIQLGPFNPGDRLMIAIGSDGFGNELTGGNDVGDSLVLDLRIALNPIPEPSGTLAVSIAAAALLGRRRRM
jgi:hypothetical protein